MFTNLSKLADSMTTTNKQIALADRLEAYADGAVVSISDLCEAARLLRESAQREAALNNEVNEYVMETGNERTRANEAERRAETAERALAVKVAAMGETLLACPGNHKIPVRLCPDKKCPVCEAQGALATAEADAFKRGVEASEQKCHEYAAHIAKQPGFIGYEWVGSELGAAAKAADACAEAIHTLLPPTPAATETHEFVLPVFWIQTLHPDEVGCGREANGRLCGLPRSHPVHGGK